MCIRERFIIDLLKVALLSFKGEHAEDRMEKLEYKWQSDFNVIVTLSAIKGIGNKSIQMLYSACNARTVSYTHLDVYKRQDQDLVAMQVLVDSHLVAT